MADSNNSSGGGSQPKGGARPTPFVSFASSRGALSFDFGANTKAARKRKSRSGGGGSPKGSDRDRNFVIPD